MFLTGKKNAVVVDIGGTTTDVGVLVNGFPREASSQVKVMIKFIFIIVAEYIFTIIIVTSYHFYRLVVCVLIFKCLMFPVLV